MNLFLAFVLTIVTLRVPAEAANKIRHVWLAQDRIEVVHTAIGIASIIQVPDRPNSLVVGDTEAFKVEYLDQAITIKPLRAGARSNLYIYTDYRRFNLQLVTGAEVTADYVVYLDPPKEKEAIKQAPPSLRWTKFRSRLKNDTLFVEVNRLGRTKEGVLIVEMKITGTCRESIDPKWFWLTQGASTKPIHRLILSRLEVSPKEPVDGMIQILSSDISDSVPLKIELRSRQTSSLSLPEVKLWK